MKKRGTQDLHIDSLRPLIAPAILAREIPMSAAAYKQVTRHRQAIAKVVHGHDKRLVVVVGPCSIHDTKAALEYGQRLGELADKLANDLLLVMRCYFEKPRTTVGWKGLINDPHLDGSYAINEGLRAARTLLCKIVEQGLPVGCEFLDPISPQFIADLVSWGAIGARTTESQVHRELASGLSMPVGFKNGTDGSVKVAVEGVIAAKHPHNFLGVTEQGLAAIVATQGNSDCHIILRGGATGPNYHHEAVREAVRMLKEAGLPPSLMVDVSHGNSSKDYRKQPVVAAAVAAQVAAHEPGIFGLMMESFLQEGAQSIAGPAQSLVYGQSVTDACIGWDTTVEVLTAVAQSARTRRVASR